MKRKTVIMDENNMKRAVARITYEILERNKGTDDLCVVGIFSRGVALAQRIASKIYELEHEKIPCGALDITAYRDDRKPADTFDRKMELHSAGKIISWEIIMKRAVISQQD